MTDQRVPDPPKAPPAPDPDTCPMTVDELREWLSLRVANPADLDGLIAENIGRTRAEMERAYEDTHPPGWTD